MRRKRNDYKADLLADLRNRDYAKGYLSAAAKESAETLLLALRDVAEAQQGMAKVASEAKVNRENLYRMLSEEGNPRLSSLYAVLDALGFFIDIGVQGTTRVSAEPVPQALAETMSAENQLVDVGDSYSFAIGGILGTGQLAGTSGVARDVEVWTEQVQGGSISQDLFGTSVSRQTPSGGFRPELPIPSGCNYQQLEQWSLQHGEEERSPVPIQT